MQVDPRLVIAWPVRGLVHCPLRTELWMRALTREPVERELLRAAFELLGNARPYDRS